ncbi:hypothetical protein GCM10027570_53170 [Streptomonospora sediminis]
MSSAHASNSTTAAETEPARDGSGQTGAVGTESAAPRFRALNGTGHRGSVQQNAATGAYMRHRGRGAGPNTFSGAVIGLLRSFRDEESQRPDTEAAFDPPAGFRDTRAPRPGRFRRPRGARWAGRPGDAQARPT